MQSNTSAGNHSKAFLEFHHRRILTSSTVYHPSWPSVKWLILRQKYTRLTATSHSGKESSENDFKSPKIFLQQRKCATTALGGSEVRPGLYQQRLCTRYTTAVPVSSNFLFEMQLTKQVCTRYTVPGIIIITMWEQSSMTRFEPLSSLDTTLAIHASQGKHYTTQKLTTKTGLIQY